MTPCERFEHEFLERGLRSDLLVHTTGCARCRAWVEAARSLEGLGLEAPPTPEEQRAVDAWTRRTLDRAPSPRRRVPAPVWPMVAVAAGFAGLLLWSATWNQEAPPPSPEARRPPTPALAAEEGPRPPVEPRGPGDVRFVAGTPRCVVDQSPRSSVCVSGVGALAEGTLTLEDGTATIDTERPIDVSVMDRRFTVERGWVELRVVRGVIAGVVAETNTVLHSDGVEVRRVSRRDAPAAPQEPVARPGKPRPRDPVTAVPSAPSAPIDLPPADADLVTSTFRRARDARRLNDVVTAIEAYQSVLRLSTDSQTRQFVLVAIGELSLQTGRTAEACEAFGRARREAGSLAREAWLGQIACLRRVDPASAETLADAFRNAFPDDPSIPSATQVAPR